MPTYTLLSKQTRAPWSGINACLFYSSEMSFQVPNHSKEEKNQEMKKKLQLPTHPRRNKEKRKKNFRTFPNK